MKRKSVYLQFLDEGIIVLKNNKIYKYDLPTIIYQYKIIKTDEFINNMKVIIDELKINNNILSDNVFIIIDSLFQEYEKMYIINIFKDLYFNEISFIKVEDLLKINNSSIDIRVSRNMIIIYTLEKTYYVNIYFEKYFEVLYLYLKNIMRCKEIKLIRFFGDSKSIVDLLSKIELKIKNNIYIYAKSDIIPISLLET